MVEAPGYFNKPANIFFIIRVKSNLKGGFCRPNYNKSDVKNDMILLLILTEEIATLYIIFEK
jgi:hypothetical protein